MAKPKKLKPTGHSAFIEALIQPAIVIGSTLMSAIAAYVLGLDELTHILAGNGVAADWFVVALCAGMGFLIDMAIIVSATRYKMHTVRADPREQQWKQLAKWVLIIGLTTESMTLLYFFVHLNPVAFPALLRGLADAVHAALAVSRAFLPPLVLAYFVAGILPVIVERNDRNREIKVRTSQNILLLIDRLSDVEATNSKQEMLIALGGQLMLDTYATYDAIERTTEADQNKRDVKLLMHLARLNSLDVDFITGLLDVTVPAPFPATEMHQASPFVPAPSAYDAPRETVTVYNDAAPPPPAAFIAPRPGTTTFRRALKRVTQELITAHQTITLYVLSQRLSASAAAIQTDIRFLIEEATGKLKPRQSITDPVLVTLGGLLEPVTVR